jgi:hypothetical protein
MQFPQGIEVPQGYWYQPGPQPAPSSQGGWPTSPPQPMPPSQPPQPAVPPTRGQQRDTRRRSPWAPVIFVVFFLIAGVWCLTMHSSQLASAAGHVTSQRMETVQNYRHGEPGRLCVERYTFTVAGRTYAGRQIREGDMTCRDTTGQSVTVYYDPARPATASSIGSTHSFQLYVGVGCLVLAVVIMIFTIRAVARERRRRRTPAPPGPSQYGSAPPGWTGYPPPAPPYPYQQ